MKHSLIFLKAVFCLVAVMVLPSALSQPVISSNRFLFIVETSRAMKQRLPAASQSVQELLESGLHGQLRLGDTIGLWTYDSELHAGVFPMQIWVEEKRTAIAQATAEYLGQQKPKGRARLAAVLPEMLRLLEDSDTIMVLLFSDGTQPVQGTPFDESINDAFKQHRDELRAAHLPFVTVLVGRAGKVVKCTMNSSIRVSLPVLPQPERAAPAAAVSPPLPQPLKTNASLIVDYSKSNLVTAISGGARTQDVPSGAPMAKAGATNAEKTAYVQPRVLLEPPAVKMETNLPPPATGALTAEVQRATSEPMVIPPEPPTVVKTTPPPLIVADTLQVSNGMQSEAAVQPGWGGRGMVVAGLVGLLLVGGIFVWWTLGAVRSRTKGSLITKSFDRGKK